MVKAPRLLRAILDHVALRSGGRVWCHAHVATTSLYERHGFVEHGDPFGNDVAGTLVLMSRRTAAR